MIIKQNCIGQSSKSSKHDHQLLFLIAAQVTRPVPTLGRIHYATLWRHWKRADLVYVSEFSGYRWVLKQVTSLN